MSPAAEYHSTTAAVLQQTKPLEKSQNHEFQTVNPQDTDYDMDEREILDLYSKEISSNSSENSLTKNSVGGSKPQQQQQHRAKDKMKSAALVKLDRISSISSISSYVNSSNSSTRSSSRSRSASSSSSASVFHKLSKKKQEQHSNTKKNCKDLNNNHQVDVKNTTEFKSSTSKKRKKEHRQQKGGSSLRAKRVKHQDKIEETDSATAAAETCKTEIDPCPEMSKVRVNGNWFFSKVVNKFLFLFFVCFFLKDKQNELNRKLDGTRCPEVNSNNSEEANKTKPEASSSSSSEEKLSQANAAAIAAAAKEKINILIDFELIQACDQCKLKQQETEKELLNELSEIMPILAYKLANFNCQSYQSQLTAKLKQVKIYAELIKLARSVNRQPPRSGLGIYK